jgi:hypothetical protein
MATKNASQGLPGKHKKGRQVRTYSGGGFGAPSFPPTGQGFALTQSGKTGWIRRSRRSKLS